MEIKLKDCQDHWTAYTRTRELFPNEIGGYVFYFTYMAELQKLDDQAVRTHPGHRYNCDGLVYTFLYPGGLVDDLAAEEINGDLPMEPLLLAVDGPLVHDLDSGAVWCGVSRRTLQRWMRGEKGRPPIRYAKHGKHRIFLEVDLWAYMAKYAVGSRWKYATEYREGQIIPEIDNEPGLPGADRWAVDFSDFEIDTDIFDMEA